MQQTKSYWRLVAVAGVVSAFVASACVVTTSTDDDDDDNSAGTGGASTAGTSSGGKGGAASAGTAGTPAGTAGTAPTGGAGPVPFQCDPDDGAFVGTPNSCVPDDPDNDCQKCIQAKCCTEYEQCYATSPGNQCGWGGPSKLPSGKAYPGGEGLCIKLGIQDGVELSGVEPDAELTGMCAANCNTTTATGGAHECGPIIGNQTDELIRCLGDNCSKVCFGPLDPG